jgi:FixJ family two-component response regulator
VSRVFVVDDDDDYEVRSSLCAVIETKGFSAQGFSSAADFRARYQPASSGCLVLDVQMPRQSGLEMYEQLLREGKRLPVIFMTGQPDVTTAVAAMKAGAIEFLEKPFDYRTLLDRIEKALELDAVWRRRDQEFTAIEQRMDQLTSRETETLELILVGESNKSMAARLFISERAVEMRRAAIMRKLDVRSLAELLNVAVTHRLLAELHHATRQPRCTAK